jgi:predicted RNA binding protein YcfA (HicA-like mRNA interferase family)/predicted RNase H-like HicB family nuclease
VKRLRRRATSTLVHYAPAARVNRRGVRRLDASVRQRERQCGVKVREVIKLIDVGGWRHVRTKGGRRQFRHPVKPGTVTIAGKLGVDVPKGTLNSILKQPRLKTD